MAKTKNTGYVEKQPKREKLPFGKTQFVLNNLDDGQIEELNKLEENPPDLYAFLSDCVDKGLDVKLAFDNYSGGYQAIAMGAWKGFPSAELACSGFSRHGCDDALFVLWYKVAVICQFDLSSAAGRDERSKKERW